MPSARSSRCRKRMSAGKSGELMGVSLGWRTEGTGGFGGRAVLHRTQDEGRVLPVCVASLAAHAQHKPHVLGELEFGADRELARPLVLASVEPRVAPGRFGRQVERFRAEFRADTQGGAAAQVATA